jgi:hypothetical protein
MSKEALNPETAPTEAPSIFGFMRGSVIIPPDADLTEPVCDELCLEDVERPLRERLQD